MKHARALLAAMAILALAITPVAAQDHEEPELLPEFLEERVYFHCNGETKVANVHAVADNAIVGWDTEAPAASFTEGAGCGTADSTLTGAADHNALYDAPFEGDFSGNLDALTVHAHSLLPPGANLTGSFTVKVLLQIDGQTIIGREEPIEVEAIESDTGASALLEFTVTDIGLIDELEGPGKKPHHVQLTLMTHYTDDHNNWVFDATEVDSGITFNPETPAAHTVTSQG